LLEDLSWEDETRLTFIELSILMDKVANPLDAIIDFAWASGADLFFVNNAKDELKRLQEKSREMSLEAFRANQFAVEEMNKYLSTVEELENLKKSLVNPVAYAKITNDGMLYDLNRQNNPYYDQTKVIPLYRIKDG
jgi:hypothetical protein